MASACGMVRGKPSNRQPRLQSGCFSRSLTRPMMMSSDTSAPASITFFAARPSGVPAFTAARSMSPVEICGMPKCLVRYVACVPLPAPGGPRRINRILLCLPLGQHSTHRLEVLRRVHAGGDRGLAHGHRDAVAVRERPELLEGFRLLELGRFQGGEFLQKLDPIAVNSRVAVPGAAFFPRERYA